MNPSHAHPRPDFPAHLDTRPLGLDRDPVPLEPFTALLAAAMAGCQPCQATRMAAAVAADPLLPGHAAGLLYTALTEMATATGLPLASALGGVTPATYRVLEVFARHPVPGEPLGAACAALTPGDRRDVFEDVLDMLVGMAVLPSASTIRLPTGE